MTRKELAQAVFEMLKGHTTMLKDKALWRAIAETDDDSLLAEYERLTRRTCKHVMRISCGAYPCTDCPRDSLPKWEPKQTDVTDIDDGSMKVGDEVRIKGSDPVKDDCDYGICTRSLPNINTIYVMRRDGSSGEENKDEWYRTGRHFPQIAEVLDILRGEK